MTSAQSMLTGHPTARAIVAICLTLACLAHTGCGQKRSRLYPPNVIVAPYDTTEGEVLWAVIPPRNESGTSVADAQMTGDAIVAAVQSVRGVRCLPLNRTIEAMRALEMEEIGSPREAEQLARALGADGVVAGSITAYDPYDPPVMGLALALYAQPGAMAKKKQTALSPYALTRAYTDANFLASNFKGKPVTVAAEILDARDHSTLLHLREYAEGRSDPETALGWKVHTASMDLYTRFAAHHTVRRLLDEEWIRLAREASEPAPRRTP